MSANIHEIHSQAISDIIDNGELDMLTPQEIVAVMSVFTPYTVKR